jgi:hypothetical protein
VAEEDEAAAFSIGADDKANTTKTRTITNNIPNTHDVVVFLDDSIFLLPRPRLAVFCLHTTAATTLLYCAWWSVLLVVRRSP